MRKYPALICKICSLFLLVNLQISLLAQEHPMMKEFRDPPKKYSMVPFWSWNGTLKADELKRQIDLMIEQGVYGAFLHARAGINYGETPYFSEGWWEAVDATVEHARAKGFKAWLYDEDKWPSGSAGGRTILKDPDAYVKKGLQCNVTRIKGPANIQIKGGPALRIFGIKTNEEESFQRESQIDLTSLKGQEWKVPEGEWAILYFRVIRDSREAPVTHIDYLDKEAVEAFLEITNDAYYKRYGEHFGNTIPGVFFDEIYFNHAEPMDEEPSPVLSWTDDFNTGFLLHKDYDILDELPSLVYKSSLSASVNYDYYSELTRRYDEAWFKQYADWCDKHGIELTGHTMEDFHAYQYEGDFMKTIGRLQMPGTDNEEFRYNFPRYIKWYKPRWLTSASNIYGKKATVVEAMGGGGYMITPEEYRYGISRLAVNGINFFIPHFFHYSVENLPAYTDWPPSWFFRNPYWKYFKPLADFSRRISYINMQGNQVSHVAVLFPLSEQWASGSFGEVDPDPLIQVQDYLLNHQIEFNVINEEALIDAEKERGQIRIHEAAFKVLILPSIHLLSVETARAIADFQDSGGVVIALEQIPTASVHGKDGEVRSIMNSLFGIKPELAGKYYDVDPITFQAFTSHESSSGGVGHYTKTIHPLADILDKYTYPELELLEGPRTALRFHQRLDDGVFTYLIMNEEKQPNHFVIQVPTYGTPWWLDPVTGEVEKVNRYLSLGEKIRISMDMEPWETRVLAILPGYEDKEVMLSATNLQDAFLDDNENELRLTGWARMNRPHTATISHSNGASQTHQIDAVAGPETAILDGVWQFQTAQHQLDRKWTETISWDTLAIPVMHFFANHDRLDLSFTDRKFDDSHFPLVKITDLFSDAEGCERYLNDWNASRIIYYDLGNHFPPIGGQDVKFRKSFMLEGVPAEALFRITAEPSYILLVNGSEIGKDSNLETVETYNLAPWLKPGTNEILIKADSHRGVIAEGILRDGDRTVWMHTDESWEVFQNGIWEQALEHSKPPLGGWKGPELSWREPGVPVECWYRQELPVGSKKLLLPSRSGSFEFYVNGDLQTVSSNQVIIPDQESSTPAILSIRATLEKGDKGLLEPLRVICGPAETELIPWDKLGLAWYTGRVVYSREFKLPRDFDLEKHRIILDPGDLKWFAEVWVNGELVDYNPWGKYRTDVTKFLKKGRNRISLVVSNLKANEALHAIPDEALDDSRNRWWQQGATLRERERLESGLKGPVRLIPLHRIDRLVQ